MLPDIRAGLRMVNASAKVGDVDAALRQARALDAHMPAAKRHVLWNTVLKACSNASACSKASEVFAEMTSRRAAPTPRTFGKLATAAARSGSLSAAEGWLQEMQRRDLQPDIVLYHAMLDAAAKAHDTSAAEKWYAEMSRARCRPDALTLTSLVDSFAKEGRYSEAERWFDRLVSMSVSPNVWTFNTLISAAGRTGNLKAAESWLPRMVELALEPDAATYNALVYAAAKREDAEEIFRRMVATSVPPSRITLRTLGGILGGHAVSRLCRELGIDEGALARDGGAGPQKRLFSPAPAQTAACNSRVKRVSRLSAELMDRRGFAALARRRKCCAPLHRFFFLRFA
mmetsp:Transcript_123841/g.395738  ORF Transcript_123841/g.395738 Transcript_123841/m.395738 type:complete len:343 (+) Transcript_123841:193-1221(+)